MALTETVHLAKNDKTSLNTFNSQNTCVCQLYTFLIFYNVVTDI